MMGARMLTVFKILLFSDLISPGKTRGLSTSGYDYDNAVRDTFQEGIVYILSFAERLSKVERNQQWYQKITADLVRANNTMQLAEDLTISELKRVDKETEKFTNERSKLRNEMNIRRSGLDALNAQLKSYEESKQRSLAALEETKRSADNAREMKKSAEASMQHEKEMQKYALLALGINIELGIAAYLIHEQHAKEAQNRLDEAMLLLSSITLDIDYFSKEINDYEKQLTQTRKRIDHFEWEISIISEKVVDLQRLVEVITGFQVILRKCITLVSQLVGKLHVGAILSKIQVPFTELVSLLKEIVDCVIPITNDERYQNLSSAELQYFIEQLWYASAKMKLFPGGTSNIEIDGYV